jgi:hypothetical protein
VAGEGAHLHDSLEDNPPDDNDGDYQEDDDDQAGDEYDDGDGGNEADSPVPSEGDHLGANPGNWLVDIIKWPSIVVGATLGVCLAFILPTLLLAVALAACAGLGLIQIGGGFERSTILVPLAYSAIVNGILLLTLPIAVLVGYGVYDATSGSPNDPEGNCGCVTFGFLLLLPIPIFTVDAALFFLPDQWIMFEGSGVGLRVVTAIVGFLTWGLWAIVPAMLLAEH